MLKTAQNLVRRARVQRVVFTWGLTAGSFSSGEQVLPEFDYSGGSEVRAQRGKTPLQGQRGSRRRDRDGKS